MQVMPDGEKTRPASILIFTITDLTTGAGVASEVLDGTTGAMVATDGTTGATAAAGAGTDGIDGTTGATAAVGLADGAGTTGVTVVMDMRGVHLTDTVLIEDIIEATDMHTIQADVGTITIEVQFLELILLLHRGEVDRV